MKHTVVDMKMPIGFKAQCTTCGKWWYPVMENAIQDIRSGDCAGKP